MEITHHKSNKLNAISQIHKFTLVCIFGSLDQDDLKPK